MYVYNYIDFMHFIARTLSYEIRFIIIILILMILIDRQEKAIRLAVL